jgi:hypothetical protein
MPLTNPSPIAVEVSQASKEFCTVGFFYIGKNLFRLAGSIAIEAMKFLTPCILKAVKLLLVYYPLNKPELGAGSAAVKGSAFAKVVNNFLH